MSELDAYRSQGFSVASDATAKVIWPRARKNISVEIVDAMTLAETRESWADLLARADAPNVFMNPALVQAAAQSDSTTQHRTLMAWRLIDGHRQLAGIWAFAIRRPRKSPLPIRVLVSPTCDHCYLATPVVDRDGAEETLDAMLDGIVEDRRLPKILALDMVAADVPTTDALMRVLARRNSPPCVFGQSRRPKLESALDGGAYLANALSASTRKKLRQHRRKLADKGALTFEIASTADAVSRALEKFLAMEAAGWKGRQGTALLDNTADAAFARGAVNALAEAGCASIHSLYLDGRPVSMQVVMRSDAASFTWKTTYDEAYQEFSPGMLLLEDYTAAFLQDKSIAFVDSCSFDDGGFMSAWTERQAVADLWIDARRGGSLMFRIMCGLQQRHRKARDVVKNLYLAWQKSNWSKSRKR